MKSVVLLPDKTSESEEKNLGVCSSLVLYGMVVKDQISILSTESAINHTSRSLLLLGSVQKYIRPNTLSPFQQPFWWPRRPAPGSQSG